MWDILDAQTSFDVECCTALFHFQGQGNKGHACMIKHTPPHMKVAKYVSTRAFDALLFVPSELYVESVIQAGANRRLEWTLHTNRDLNPHPNLQLLLCSILGKARRRTTPTFYRGGSSHMFCFSKHKCEQDERKHEHTHGAPLPEIIRQPLLPSRRLLLPPRRRPQASETCCAGGHTLQ